MTHPVYAAIARERARFDAPADDLAERVVENLRTVAESGDRVLLKDRQPDPDGNGWAWSPGVEADVAQAVSLTAARARVVVLDPTRQAVRRG